VERGEVKISHPCVGKKRTTCLIRTWTIKTARDVKNHVIFTSNGMSGRYARRLSRGVPLQLDELGEWLHDVGRDSVAQADEAERLFGPEHPLVFHMRLNAEKWRNEEAQLIQRRLNNNNEERREPPNRRPSLRLVAPIVRRQQQQQVIVIEDDDTYGGASPALSRRLIAPAMQRHVIVIDDDDDEQGDASELATQVSHALSLLQYSQPTNNDGDDDSESCLSMSVEEGWNGSERKDLSPLTTDDIEAENAREYQRHVDYENLSQIAATEFYNWMADMH
jgi:hypothetical protein